MAPRKSAAADKAAVTAPEAEENQTLTDASEAAENAPESPPGGNFAAGEANGPIDVVVMPKNTLRHDGQTYRQHQKVSLPADEVPRLVKRGVVVTLEQARKDALALEGVSITAVNSGVRIGPVQ